MRKSLFVLLLVSLFGFNTYAETSISAEAKGLQIFTTADAANEGFQTEKSETQMDLINAHGDKVVRKMTMKLMEVEGDGDKSVIEFLWPADVKETRLLSWSHKVGNDDQWLFLPALNRVKRISSTKQSGSFMGSEFSYEDVSSDEVEKYTYKYIEDSTLGERDVWIIERYPVNKKSGYSKQIVWLDKQYQNPLKIDYYDRKGEHLKTSTFSGYTKIGSWWRQNKIEMVNHQTQKTSVLTWKYRTLSEPIPARTFTKASLLD